MPITKEEVAEAVQRWFAAWNSKDITIIAAMEARAVGLGWRAFSSRERDYVARGGEAGVFQRRERLFGRMDNFRLELEDLQTAVAGDVGLAWGVFIEEFQEKGQPPERARVRFSKVLTKGATDWQILFFHRDIQPFDEEGRYPKALTVVTANG